MQIEPLASEHVRAVADLHCSSLRGLLSELGPRAARIYYQECVISPLAVGLVAVAHPAHDSAGILGFVLGSPDAATLRRDVTRRRSLGVATAIALGVARRPRALRWVLASLRGVDEPAYERHLPELTYLAVAPGQRGSGVGRHLVQAFSAALRERGASRYELSVDEDNLSAIGFYERTGFVRVGRYREFGQWHARYAMELPAPILGR